jgi:hypothetical protein
MNRKFQGLRVLDSKVLFITIFLTLHILFMLGQGQCSAIAPDEITYLAVFRDTFLGIPNPGLAEVYGSSRFIYYLYYFPGFVFNLIFQNAIYAIRFSAIVFSLFIFLISERIISNAQPANSQWLKRIFKLSFLFIPSIFVFTGSGIRESLLIFSLISTIYGFKLILQNNFKIGFLIFTIGMLFSTSAKIYLFPILALSTVIVAYITKENRIRNVFLIIASAFISLAIFWQPISHVVLNVEYQRPSNTSTASDPSPNNYEKTALNPKGILASSLPSATSLWLNYCFQQNTLGFLKSPIKQLFWDTVPNPSESINQKESGQSPMTNGANQVEAGQSPMTNGANQVEAGQSPAAVLYRFYEFRRVLPVEQIPLNILKFLTNPILDLKSKYLLVFLIEFPFWILGIFILLLSFLGVRRLRFDWNWLTVYSALIFIMFLVYSGATEVNVGTSIRHRTFLWIPLIFLLTGIRRDTSLGSSKPSGNSTQ